MEYIPRVEKDILGETLAKYQEIALIMNSFPFQKKNSIEELAEKADVHWNTAKKALAFFLLSEPILPRFRIDKDFRFTILEKPRAIDAVNIIYESDEMIIITKMMLKKITDKQKGLKMEELKSLGYNDISAVYSLLEKGYINSEDGVFFLSFRGKILGNTGIKKILDLGLSLPWEENSREITPYTKEIRKRSVTIVHIEEEDTVIYGEYRQELESEKNEVESPTKILKVPIR